MPFPSPKGGQVFIAAQTVTSTGAMQNQFAPGSSVIFRAYAVDGKIKKELVTKDVKYFYVTIPNQPNVKMTYKPKAPGATGRMVWIGHLDGSGRPIPRASCNFKVLIKTEAKRTGAVRADAGRDRAADDRREAADDARRGPAATGAPRCPTHRVSLYVDTVNGTQPVGAPKRAVGCSQTNVYKRGEQVVVRVVGLRPHDRRHALDRQRRHRHLHDRRPGRGTPQLRRPWCRRGQGLLLVSAVDRSADLPAR